MPLYECIFIARQDISAGQAEQLAERFSNIITENGGQVAKTEMWGLRNLAYRIKKNRKGHYVLFNIDAPSDALLEMERNMRINESVLRYLTTRVEKLEEGPSAVMQSRHGRDDRGRGGRHGPRGGRDGGGRDGGGRDGGGRDGGGARGAPRDRAPAKEAKTEEESS